MTSSTPGTQDLDGLFGRHDSEPESVALALRELALGGPLVPGAQRRFAWLVNHVIGERLGRWPEAHEVLEAALAQSPDGGCLLHRSVAAYGAGQALMAFDLVPRIAQAAGCRYVAADIAAKLMTVQFSSASTPAGRLAEVFNGIVEVVDSMVADFGQVATQVASALNNITSRLLDSKGVDIQAQAYRKALTDGARVCEAVWQIAGTWVNQERADYLVALCANRLQDFTAAQGAARAALETIERNGVQDVDRAFLLLELARACTGLGCGEEARTARAEALRLAGGFDAKLREWFDERAST